MEFGCLNPCCNGIYSIRAAGRAVFGAGLCVLILVVMEYTQ